MEVAIAKSIADGGGQRGGVLLFRRVSNNGGGFGSGSFE